MFDTEIIRNCVVVNNGKYFINWLALIKSGVSQKLTARIKCLEMDSVDCNRI